MSQTTNIEWLARDGKPGKTWNPITGCSAVSEGCANCWAKRMARRLHGMGNPHYRNGFEPTYHLDRLDEPTRWREPTHCAVSLMGDLFHPKIPPRFIQAVIAVMAACRRHTFYILTKRPEQLRHIALNCNVKWAANMWLGVSIEGATRAVERMLSLVLCQIGPAHSFLSVEPLLEPIELMLDKPWFIDRFRWVIIGCESGPRRRPCKLEWVRDLVRQCRDLDIPPFVKQLNIGGRVSRDPNEWPEDVRVREVPVSKE